MPLPMRAWLNSLRARFTGRGPRGHGRNTRSPLTLESLESRIVPSALSVTVDRFSNNTPAVVAYNDGAGHAGTDNTLLTQFGATLTDDAGNSTRFKTFCVDLWHTVSQGQTYLVDPRSDLDTAFVNGARIAYVFQKYGQMDLSANPIQAAAVQLAIWDLELNNHNPTSFTLQPDGSYSSGDSNVFDVRMDGDANASAIAALTNQYLSEPISATTQNGWLDAAAQGDYVSRGQSLLLPTIQASGVAAVSADGASFTGVIANFTTTYATTNSAETAGLFTATITWPDGSSTPGTITGNGGSFTVSGSASSTFEADPGTVNVTISMPLTGLSTSITSTISDDPPAPPGYTIFFSGGGDGVSWNDAENWNLDRLPGVEDDVLIPVGYHVEHSGGSVELHSLTSYSDLDYTGNLTLDSRSSESGVLNYSGELDLAAGSAFDLSGGGSFAGTAALSDGSNLNLRNAAYSIADGSVVVGAGVANLTSGATMTVNGLVQVANLTQDQSLLTIPGSLHITNLFVWLGGDIDAAGDLTVDKGKEMEITGANAKEINGGIVNNNGSMRLSANVRLTKPTTINNAGFFTITGDFSVSALGAAAKDASAFINLGPGTLSKATGDGLGGLAIPFKNEGNVFARSGTLFFSAGGTLNGSWTVGARATIAFLGGEFDSSGRPQFRGDLTGLFLIDELPNGGNTTVIFSKSVIPFAKFELRNGTLATLNNAVFRPLLEFLWSGGAIAGNVRIGSGERMRIATPADGGVTLGADVKGVSSKGIIDDEGTIDWSSGDIDLINGSNINVLGTFNAFASGRMRSPDASATLWKIPKGGKLSVTGNATYDHVLQIEGLLQVNKAAFTVGALLNGSIFDPSEGRVDLTQANLVLRAGTMSNGGTLNINNSIVFGSIVNTKRNATITASGISVVQGGLRLDDGKLLLDNDFVIAQSMNGTGGSVFLNGHTLTVGAGATLSGKNARLDMAGGVLSVFGGPLTIANGFLFEGSGTINAAKFVNDGVIQVGGANAIGTLTLDGDYEQGESGTIQFDVKASNGQWAYDVFKVSGAAKLAGTIRVDLLGNIPPALRRGHARLKLMNDAAQDGTFGTKQGIIAGPEPLFALVTDATGLFLNK